MSRKYQRYDQYDIDKLRSIVSDSTTFTEVCRKLDRKPVGGSISNVKLMCERLDIDYSHMVGKRHAKGKPSRNRLSPTQRLRMGCPMDHRTEAHKLRISLFEVGVEHKCNKCGLGSSWNGKDLVLEIDHMDGQYWNNTLENLQFLCPNCHSQKPKTKT